MKLKIFSKQGTVRYQFDITTAEEGRKLADLHLKPTDSAYIYFQMNPNEAVTLKDGNGRMLSRAEVRRLSNMEPVSKRPFTSLKYKI